MRYIKDVMHYFNPRSPHGERLRHRPLSLFYGDFNPRSPHGERRGAHLAAWGSTGISIHAPRTGSDPICISFPIWSAVFQSTLPARGATAVCPRLRTDSAISIHAPRTGSDCRRCRCAAFRAYFNPRSPHGERRRAEHHEGAGRLHFNPRSPHGERRGDDCDAQSQKDISIHAPRTGSDCLANVVPVP